MRTEQMQRQLNGFLLLKVEENRAAPGVFTAFSKPCFLEAFAKWDHTREKQRIKVLQSISKPSPPAHTPTYPACVLQSICKPSSSKRTHTYKPSPTTHHIRLPSSYTALLQKQIPVDITEALKQFLLIQPETLFSWLLFFEWEHFRLGFFPFPPANDKLTNG